MANPILANPILADSNFGQSNFGQSMWIWCVCHGGTEGWGPNPEKVGPESQDLELEGGAPKGGGPKISRFFSLSHTHFRSFCLFLGVFSLNFGGVFDGRDLEMCTFGVLGLSCEAPAAHSQTNDL